MSHQCPECKKSGYDVQVLLLSTYGQRSNNLANTDGTRHIHYFKMKEYRWSTLIAE